MRWSTAPHMRWSTPHPAYSRIRSFVLTSAKCRQAQREIHILLQLEQQELRILLVLEQELHILLVLEQQEIHILLVSLEMAMEHQNHQ